LVETFAVDKGAIAAFDVVDEDLHRVSKHPNPESEYYLSTIVYLEVIILRMDARCMSIAFARAVRQNIRVPQPIDHPLRT
jgi:hypothetical protein